MRKNLENAQIVLGDAPVGIADEAHPPGIEIGEAADMVMHHAVGWMRKGRSW